MLVARNGLRGVKEGVMIVGYDYAGSLITTDLNPVVSYEWMKIQNIIADEVYAENGINNDIVDSGIPPFEEWGYDTIMHATFRKFDAKAGNSDFLKESVSKLRIKRRLEGETQWKTIYETDVDQDKTNPFDIVYWDYLEPSNKTIEYEYVAVVSGVEQEAATASVESKFKDYFVVGQDKAYPVVVDAANEVTYNRESNTIVSPGNKYPYVVNNGVARYYSGTLTGGFYEFLDVKSILDTLSSLKRQINEAVLSNKTSQAKELKKEYDNLYNEHFYSLESRQNYEYDFEKDNNWKLRRIVDQFLTDGMPKLIKNFEGDMWMVNIVGSIPRNTNDHWQYVTYSIEWTECGDPSLIGDLYDNGFINTDIDRE